ncbi:hypothetical protein ACXZ66_13120 [Corynebacterium sp. S7]
MNSQYTAMISLWGVVVGLEYVGALLGVWGNIVVSFLRSLRDSAVAGCSGCGVVGGGVLCENCIVDASIFILFCVCFLLS